MELEWDFQRTYQDLTTAQIDAREASTSVFGIEEAVSNLTPQLYYAVCNSVAAVRLLVNRIHSPSVEAPLPAPGGAQDKGANGCRGEGDGGTGAGAI